MSSTSRRSQGVKLYCHLARPPARRLFGNPCFTQIHPTCIPLSSEYSRS